MEPKVHQKNAGAAKGNIRSVPSDADNSDTELRPIDSGNTMKKKTNAIILAVYLMLVLMGIGTGLLLSGKSNVLGSASKGAGSAAKAGQAAGSADTKTFKDSAVGVIEKGGIDGEGTHKLIRDGGPSQTAFLVSSVVDLDQYVGKKVKVWGETFSAKKASWLMDVGKIELQK